MSTYRCCIVDHCQRRAQLGNVNYLTCEEHRNHVVWGVIFLSDGLFKQFTSERSDLYDYALDMEPQFAVRYNKAIYTADALTEDEVNQARYGADLYDLARRGWPP